MNEENEKELWSDLDPIAGNLEFGKKVEKDPLTGLWNALEPHTRSEQGKYLVLDFADGTRWLQNLDHPGSVLRQTAEGYFHNDRQLSVRTLNEGTSEGIRMLVSFKKPPVVGIPATPPEPPASAAVVDSDNLIPIDRQSGTRFPVNARDLHGFLGIGRDFSNWMRDRISKFELVEGVEYTVCSPNLASKECGVDVSGRGGHNAKTYLLTITAARWLAADVNSEKGRQMIKFLVDVMEKAESQAPAFRLPQTYAEALRALADSEDQKARLAVTLQEEEQKSHRLTLACTEAEHTSTALAHNAAEVDRSILLTDWLKQTRSTHGHGAIIGRKILAFKGLLNKAIVKGCRHTSEAVVNGWAMDAGILTYKRDPLAPGVHKRRKPDDENPSEFVYNADGSPVMIYPLVAAVTPDKGVKYLMDLFMKTPECLLRRLVATHRKVYPNIKRLEGRYAFMHNDSSWESLMTRDEKAKVVRMKEDAGGWTVWCMVDSERGEYRAEGAGETLEKALVSLADHYKEAVI